jgi:hypothetical protein
VASNRFAVPVVEMSWLPGTMLYGMSAFSKGGHRLRSTGPLGSDGVDVLHDVALVRHELRVVLGTRVHEPLRLGEVLSEARVRMFSE